MNRVKLLDYEIDSFNKEEAVALALNMAKNNKVSQVVTINPEMFECAKTDEEFSNILKSAELIIPDGIGIQIGLKITGKNISRIPGIDFAKKVLEQTPKHNLPVAIIGAKPLIIEKAKENLEKEINGLNIVYSHNGYFKNDNLIYEEIKKSGARVILVALGSPKQEKFIHNAKDILPFGLMVGVGGSFDVWSGVVKRAPEIYQKLGIEWLYRTVKEPQRFKRIFPTLPLFLIKVLKEKLKG